MPTDIAPTHAVHTTLAGLFVPTNRPNHYVLGLYNRTESNEPTVDCEMTRGDFVTFAVCMAATFNYRVKERRNDYRSPLAKGLRGVIGVLMLSGGIDLNVSLIDL